MIKKIISLIIFVALANAGLRVGIVYFRDQQFKDALREVSLFSSGQSEEIVRGKVMQLAVEHQIPLDPDFIEITRKVVPGVGDHSAIKTTYAVMVPLFPGHKRRFDFSYATP